MKVLVCGGRNYNDLNKIFKVLDAIHKETPITLLINGDARGADQNSTAYADYRGIPTDLYPAQWDLYGKSAGFKRNLDMLMKSKPDLVVCFPGGKGTANMKALALQYKYKIIEVKDEE